MREIESFLLELGNGFAFIARQKRIRVDDEDSYIDLLLYHRKLRRGSEELRTRWIAQKVRNFIF
jgi:predicted nuclease of restriction endonuclease-like (RecB) superfamily